MSSLNSVLLAGLPQQLQDILNRSQAGPARSTTTATQTGPTGVKSSSLMKGPLVNTVGQEGLNAARLFDYQQVGQAQAEQQGFQQQARDQAAGVQGIGQALMDQGAGQEAAGKQRALEAYGRVEPKITAAEAIGQLPLDEARRAEREAKERSEANVGRTEAQKAEGLGTLKDRTASQMDLLRQGAEAGYRQQLRDIEQQFPGGSPAALEAKTQLKFAHLQQLGNIAGELGQRYTENVMGWLGNANNAINQIVSLGEQSISTAAGRTVQAAQTTVDNAANLIGLRMNLEQMALSEQAAAEQRGAGLRTLGAQMQAQGKQYLAQLFMSSDSYVNEMFPLLADMYAMQEEAIASDRPGVGQVTRTGGQLALTGGGQSSNPMQGTTYGQALQGTQNAAKGKGEAARLKKEQPAANRPAWA